MYKIQGVIPISLKDPNGVEFTTNCIEYVEHHPLKLFDLREKKQGKGTRKVYVEIGSCLIALKHRVFIFEGVVDSIPEKKPYLRLFYTYKNDQIDPESMGLIFSEEPGMLTDSNYKIIEVND